MVNEGSTTTYKHVWDRHPCPRSVRRRSQRTGRKRLGAASVRRTTIPEEICLDGLMESTKTMEAGNKVQPKWGPSERRGSHAGVKAQIREPRKGLTMDLNRKGKFDNELPNGKIGEQGVQPGMQEPEGGIKNACRGNNGEEINLFSLSFGSDTEYLAERYVIVDPEVKQNGLLEIKDLLQPEIIGAVTSKLDERFEGRRVFFPRVTRYFLAKEQSFKMMIEDLLKHREACRNGDPPLVLFFFFFF
jgi:hypothetical protein